MEGLIGKIDQAVRKESGRLLTFCSAVGLFEVCSSVPGRARLSLAEPGVALPGAGEKA